MREQALRGCRGGEGWSWPGDHHEPLRYLHHEQSKSVLKMTPRWFYSSVPAFSADRRRGEQEGEVTLRENFIPAIKESLHFYD